ncbi:LOW QUALITY PROTEIN: mannose-P-dolichol utilization defect 1 protein-like [Phycodurus eques]|uniref:LOW QUALITY PROTEIN: mannose-P-dolichol utilization defect 1 protein-like n=1 Tax=Phycodurus eques TaxID=693459 RepID=UPI002ACD6A12|nr:LOW QUALITY PROTEIN: mannose-P-dolichol utilization defect 1 protein-like [Phycodurus eques]
MAEEILLHEGTSFLDPFQGRLLEFLMPQPCYDAFFLRFNFAGGPCLKTLLSKGPGTVVLLGSMLVKLPQIVKPMAARSAEGVSFPSLLGELLAITGSLAYAVANGFPCSAWGEALFAVGFLVQRFRGRSGAGALFLLVYSGVLLVPLSPLVPSSALAALQASNMPAVTVSRVGQTRATNLRNAHTGQLSALTVAILFAGSLARIFTSVQETGDTLLVVTYVVSVACNGLIVAQVLYYRKPTKSFLRHERRRTQQQMRSS